MCLGYYFRHPAWEMYRIIEETFLFGLLQEGGRSLMRRSISEKRKEALGFSRSKRAGRRVDKSTSKGRMDFVWGGLGMKICCICEGKVNMWRQSGPLQFLYLPASPALWEHGAQINFIAVHWYPNSELPCSWVGRVRSLMPQGSWRGDRGS